MINYNNNNQLINRWLDSGCEDRKTWRVLTPAGTVPIDKDKPKEKKDVKSSKQCAMGFTLGA